MKKTNKFNVGDIVKLKSGGPDMTVRSIYADAHDKFDGNYCCQWFAGKKLDKGIFPEESLIDAKANEN